MGFAMVIILPVLSSMIWFTLDKTRKSLAAERYHFSGETESTVVSIGIQGRQDRFIVFHPDHIPRPQTSFDAWRSLAVANLSNLIRVPGSAGQPVKSVVNPTQNGAQPNAKVNQIIVSPIEQRREHMQHRRDIP